MTRPVLIDSDGGVDDALALLLALGSPELAIQAVTTVGGNVAADQAAANLALVQRVAGGRNRVPVHLGHARPLLRALRRATEVHGGDGLGGITAEAPWRDQPDSDGAIRESFAVRAILEAVAAFGPDLTIVAIGPLTNLAAAWLADPGLMARLGRLVIMGGAVSGVGNVTPHAEYNFFVDPEAAAIVARAEIWKTLVPLEATRQVLLTRGFVQAMSQTRPSAVSRFVAGITGAYMDSTLASEGLDGCHPHDAIALAVLLDETLFEIAGMPLGVVTDDAERLGLSRVDDPTALPAEVVTVVDDERFLALLESRVFK